MAKLNWGVLLGLALAVLPARAQTNGVAPPYPAGGTNGVAREASERQRAQRAEQIRPGCRRGERQICGRVLQVLPKGLVVDSGYTNLLDPHYRQLWVVTGTATVSPQRPAAETDEPGAPCVGLVFLTDLPKRPAVKLYDYVAIRAYPAGAHGYEPVKGIEKTIRQFAVRLSTAVRLNLVSGAQ